MNASVLLACMAGWHVHTGEKGDRFSFGLGRLWETHGMLSSVAKEFLAQAKVMREGGVSHRRSVGRLQQGSWHSANYAAVPFALLAGYLRVGCILN